MINYPVPFLSNTPDNLHCLQAAYGMIRAYFEPNWVPDWPEWATDTGFVEGKGSWSLAGLLWFKAHGYEVKHICSFDYPEFIKNGGNYLLRALGKAGGAWEIQYTDIPLEQSRSQALLTTDIWIKAVPDFAHMIELLDDGYLLKCIVNQKALNQETGFLGHAVVVKGYTQDGLILHDPGLPASAERHVTLEDFAGAWSRPSYDIEKLDAIRKI